MERSFLFTIIETRTAVLDQTFIIKGETLYKAILNELIENAGCFMWWTEDILGIDSSHEEKAVNVLELIESSDCCDYSVFVSDLTNTNEIFIIFPKDKRPENFDNLIIGKKFYINCWIPVYDDPDDRPSFTSMLEAKEELDHLQMTQPENIYRIEGE